MARFGGKVLFLDRGDINTDEIIPARYLTEVDKAALEPHLLEDLSLPGFDPSRDVAGNGVLVARANFGCGSSREHAVWALEVNGIRIVVAESFSRIFRQNMYNCGLVALELPAAQIEELFRTHAGRSATASVDVAAGRLAVESAGGSTAHRFSLAPFDRTLVEAGGWVEFADARYWTAPPAAR
jgi:3-isopropylmalate/(R)-2-methylmalate dehydratase small subunit